jgi:hypothetical protein
MPEPLPSVADLIERVGDVPIRVWPPLANSGRALWHQGVLLVSQAVFNRIAGAPTSEERAAVLRSVFYIDMAGVKDGDHVPLWPPPGGTPGSNGPAVLGRRPSGAASSRFGRWHTPGRPSAGRRPRAPSAARPPPSGLFARANSSSDSVPGGVLLRLTACV